MSELDPYRTTDVTNRHTEEGHEILNPTPIAPPLGYTPQLSLAEQIRQQVRLQALAERMDPETEEEADDFDVDDDPPIPSRWENDMVPSVKEMRIRREALEREYADAEAAQRRAEQLPPDPRNHSSRQTPRRPPDDVVETE